MSATTGAVSGVEYVEELEGGDGEDASLYRLDSATDIRIGEAVDGVPVVAQGVTHIVVVEAHMDAEEIASMMADTSEMSEEEIEQMAVMLTGETEVDEAGVAVSNEAGDPGPVVAQESDADGDTVLAQFAEEHL